MKYLDQEVTQEVMEDVAEREEEDGDVISLAMRNKSKPRRNQLAQGPIVIAGEKYCRAVTAERSTPLPYIENV